MRGLGKNYSVLDAIKKWWFIGAQMYSFIIWGGSFSFR
jgi:hypothetical protein